MIATTLAALLLAAQLGEAAPSAVVSGRVVDAVTGRPIAGAIVSSAGSAVAPPGASSPVRLMTDGGGTFVLRE